MGVRWSAWQQHAASVLRALFKGYALIVILLGLAVLGYFFFAFESIPPQD